MELREYLRLRDGPDDRQPPVGEPAQQARPAWPRGRVVGRPTRLAAPELTYGTSCRMNPWLGPLELMKMTGRGHCVTVPHLRSSSPTPVVDAEVNRPDEGYQPVVQIDLDATLTDNPTWLDQGALGVDRSYLPVS